MSLFKYLPPERIGVLQTLRVRYTQPVLFNDPFEAKPHYTGFMLEEAMSKSHPHRYHQVLSEQYESLPASFRQQISFSVFAAEMDHMRPEVYNIFQEVDASIVPEINTLLHESFGEKLGALSLSEINDSQLMWSHYADGHKGFVLEFDDSHPFFTERNVNADEIWQLHKVIYANQRPKTTVIELDLDAILMTKHVSWAYESEWKDFRPLNQASAIIEADPLHIHLFDLPPACIRSVIFGTRMADKARAAAIAVIKENVRLEHLHVLEAQLDDQTYALRIQSVL